MSIESMQRPEFDIGRVFSATFGAIGRNLGPFAGLAFLFAVVPQAAIGWFTSVGGSLVESRLLGMFSLVAVVGGLVSMIFSFILQAAIIRGAVDDLNGRKATLDACMTTAFRNLGPVFLISLLMALGMGLGFILLVVPGVILAVMWVAAVPAQVIEQRGVFASLERSSDLTTGSRWPIFGLFVLYVVLSWIVGAVVLAVGTAVSGGFTGLATSWVMQVVISPLVAGASALVGSVGSAAIYTELRMAKEGAEPQSLASVFD